MPCMSAQIRLYCLMHSSVATVGKWGREISPSCFCHSQLILPCPPHLYSSSFFAAHRIWPGPLCFQQCFLDRAIRHCQNSCYPPSNNFFSSSCCLSRWFFLCLFHLFLWSINSVSPLKKKKKKKLLWEIYFLSVATGCVTTELAVSV